MGVNCSPCNLASMITSYRWVEYVQSTRQDRTLSKADKSLSMNVNFITSISSLSCCHALKVVFLICRAHQTMRVRASYHNWPGLMKTPDFAGLVNDSVVGSFRYGWALRQQSDRSDV